MMNRRSFFSTTACVSTGLALGARAEQPAAASSHARKRVKLGVCTYSYWHFRDPKVPIETVIDKAAEFGVEGVDRIGERGSRVEVNQHG